MAISFFRFRKDLSEAIAPYNNQSNSIRPSSYKSSEKVIGSGSTVPKDYGSGVNSYKSKTNTPTPPQSTTIGDVAKSARKVGYPIAKSFAKGFIYSLLDVNHKKADSDSDDEDNIEQKPKQKPTIHRADQQPNRDYQKSEPKITPDQTFDQEPDPNKTYQYKPYPYKSLPNPTKTLK